MIRILVTGSRHWTDETRIRHSLTALVRRYCRIGLTDSMQGALNGLDVTIVHGAAPGADSIATAVATAHLWTVEPHPADWARHGRSAGPRRNREMVELGADVCLGFPIGASVGTRGCLEMARTAGILCLTNEG
jgi:hypothetical protein